MKHILSNRLCLYGCLTLTLLLSGCSKDSNTPQDPDVIDVDKFLARGDELIRMFLDGQYAEFRSNMSQDLRAQLSVMILQQVGEQLRNLYGEEASVNTSTVLESGDFFAYTRESIFTNVQRSIIFQLTFDENQIVHGFFVVPPNTAAESNFLNYVTKTDLRLPIEDEWFVFWGGRTVEQNYHAVARDQRFAYDLVQIEGTSTHINDGSRNQDYFCFDKPLFAPGGGTVVSIENNIADNVPGVRNPSQPLGNYVILDHGNGEFSFLAHFKQGSVVVQNGDRVLKGQLLGHCGNSGNSTEPHLHYHMQNSATFGNGEGLPSQFNNYLSSGVEVERGEPVQGEIIAPND